MDGIQRVCNTTDEVIKALEGIIQHCIRTNDRAGYFAVLYYCVTCRVKEGILNNEFDDGARMERLDVLFANRYLEAWHLWQLGQMPTVSWEVAFRSASLAKTIVLQHLLLGVNAHINLDLGIATAETMKGKPMEPIKGDFDRINAILKAMIEVIQGNIGKASPILGLLDLYGKSHDELLVGFSIQTAREGAWHFAQELSLQQEKEYQLCISRRDKRIAQLGDCIASPSGILLKLLVSIIKATERHSTSSTIKLLQLS